MRKVLMGFLFGILLASGIGIAFAANYPVETVTSRIELPTPSDQIINKGKLISNAITGTTGSLYMVTDTARRTYCYIVYNPVSMTSMSCVKY